MSVIIQLLKNSKKAYLFLFFIFGSIYSINAFNNEDNDYLYVYIESSRQQYIGSYVDAAKLLHTCLKYDSTDYNVLYRLSKLYAEAGDLKDALYFANKSYQFGSNNEWVTYNYISILIQTGNFVKANELIEHHLSLSSKDVNLYRINADLLIKQRKYKKALKELELYRGKNRGLELIKVHCYNRLGKYNKSIEILIDLTRAFTDDNRILGVYAETLIRTKQYNESRQIYEKILNNEPGNSLYWISYFDFGLVTNDTSVLKTFGNKLLKDRNVNFSDKLYVIDKLFKVESKRINHQAHIYLSDLKNEVTKWNSDAQILKEYIRNNYGDDEAFKFIKSLLKYNYNDDLYFRNLLYAIDIEQTDTLIKYSKIAHKNIPQNFYLTWFYAMSLKNTKKYQEAFDLIKTYRIKEIKNTDLRLEFYVLKAEVLYHLEDYHNAFLNYESALLIDSSNEMLINNYSYYLSVKNKKLDYAYSLMSKVIKNNKKNSIYLDTYAWILFKLQRYDEALNYIEKAIKYEENPIAEIYHHYGDILLALNKTKKCKEAWNKAIEIEKDKEVVSNIHEKLDAINER